jgi:hypothetical protein
MAEKKRSFVMGFIVLAMLAGSGPAAAPGLVAQELNDGYFSHPIKSKFFGYYLPVDFVSAFENTKSYFNSMQLKQENNEYISIRIDKYGIWTQEPITGDGFHENLIDAQDELRYYRFECENNEIIITSKGGNRYKKITDDFEYEIPAIDNYIGKTMLQDLVSAGVIILNNNIITIPELDHGKFRIEMWHISESYITNVILASQMPVDLYLYGFDTRWPVYMEIQDNEYTIYEPIRWNTGQTTKKIIWKKKI